MSFQPVRLLALMVVASLLIAACSGDSDDTTSGTQPPPGLDSFYQQDVVWTGCLKLDGECAGLEVPVDYGEPTGPTVNLSVRRVAAREESEGTLFFNPGGPGLSGVQQLSGFVRALSPEVRDRYDVVGFDPRGIADSEGLDCTPRIDRRSIEPPDPTPDSRAEERRLIRWYADIGRTCAEFDLARHMSSTDVARDLDVMRAVLGDEKLNYYGGSYGTVIGDIYRTLFPDRAGHLVLDAPTDRLRAEARRRFDEVKAHNRTLRGYLRFCVKRECQLGDTVGRASARLARMLERLDRRPLPAGGDRRVTENDARSAIEYGLATGAWPALTKALDDAVHGDGGRLAGLARRWLGADLSSATMLNVAGNATACVDHPERLGAEGVRRLVPKYADASPIFGRYFAWSLLACAQWPVKPAPDPSSSDGEADPVLVIGSLGDPITPYSNAVALANRTDSAVLLTSNTYGHTAYARGLACIDEKVDAYLLDGEVPDDGAQC